MVKSQEKMKNFVHFTKNIQSNQIRSVLMLFTYLYRLHFFKLLCYARDLEGKSLDLQIPGYTDIFMPIMI